VSAKDVIEVPLRARGGFVMKIESSLRTQDVDERFHATRNPAQRNQRYRRERP
jgi:hypothetical protein